MEKLKERIGIDKTVICEIAIKAIDKEKLRKKSLQDGIYINFIENEKSPIVTKNGICISELEIKDDSIGRLLIKHKQNNLTKKEMIICRMELLISGIKSNLQNLNANEYKSRVAQVFEKLEVEYGIVIDSTDVSLKEIEINCTFKLQENWNKYRAALLLIAKNMPERYGNRNEVKFMSWQSVTSSGTVLENIHLKNKTTELKIYNKSKQIKDTYPDVNCDDNLIRIEYKIKDKRMIKSNFGSRKVADITDEKINKLFRKYWQRDVVIPYLQWRDQNRNELFAKAKEHMSTDIHWVSNFVRDCRQIEAKRGLPLLFDVDDMRIVFRKLEPNNLKSAGNKFRRFRKRMEFESDLIGNSKRIKEIIYRIEEL